MLFICKTYYDVVSCLNPLPFQFHASVTFGLPLFSTHGLRFVPLIHSIYHVRPAILYTSPIPLSYVGDPRGLVHSPILTSHYAIRTWLLSFDSRHSSLPPWPNNIQRSCCRCPCFHDRSYSSSCTTVSRSPPYPESPLNSGNILSARTKGDALTPGSHSNATKLKTYWCPMTTGAASDARKKGIGGLFVVKVPSAATTAA